MLDLDLFSNGTVRGATIAQAGTSIAMASVMFGLILHFQYAYGWSPMKAGLANLPMIVTMLAATPISEGLLKRYGHRIACVVGAILLAAGLGGIAWGVEHGYVAIAASMVVMTVGLRTVMTICAVALVDAMPSNRTSIGTALNDTAQEIGTSVGTAVVGTMIAALVTTQLPPAPGAPPSWSRSSTASRSPTPSWPWSSGSSPSAAPSPSPTRAPPRKRLKHLPDEGERAAATPRCPSRPATRW